MVQDLRSSGADALGADNCLKLNLPYGIGDNYALPHAVCRGGVFSSIEYVGKASKLRPVYTKPTLIAQYGSVQVFQTAGEQLNQGAADVYAELIRLALEQPITAGQRIEVTINADSFLKSIGRDRGVNNRIWLADEIARLKRASFRYEIPGLKAWETSFVADFTEDRSFREVKTSASFVIELNARMVQVYQKGWALLNGPARRSLQGKKDHLAKALYAFYATHKYPHDISAQELKKIVGRAEILDSAGNVLRRAQQNSKWLQDLETSLANLKAATGWAVCDYRRDIRKVRIVKELPKTAAAPEQPPLQPITKTTILPLSFGDEDLI